VGATTGISVNIPNEVVTVPASAGPNIGIAAAALPVPVVRLSPTHSDIPFTFTSPTSGVRHTLNSRQNADPSLRTQTTSSSSRRESVSTSLSGGGGGSERRRQKTLSHQRCELLAGWERLIEPTYLPEAQAQAVILSCIVGLGGDYAGEHRWISPEALLNIFSYEDVAPYSGLELLLTTSIVGGEASVSETDEGRGVTGNSDIRRLGIGSGRALSVTRQWTQLTKSMLHGVALAKAGLLVGRKYKWLKDLTSSTYVYMNRCVEHYAQVEYLRREKKADGTYEMKPAPWDRHRALPTWDTSEEQRSVIRLR